MRSILVGVSPGGTDNQAEGFFDIITKSGKITLQGVQLDIKNDTELASLAFHEVTHVIQTYEFIRTHGGKPTWTDEDLTAWHKIVYRRQWDLRNDPEFRLLPGRDYTNHVFDQCVKYGGGCKKVRLPIVITGAVGAALLLAGNSREAVAQESNWWRWRPASGVVQHVLVNSGPAKKVMTLSSRLSGNCDESQRSDYLTPDRRFSSTATVDLEPGAWFAIWMPIAERSVGCTVDLIVADGNEEPRKVTSTELTNDFRFIDTLPFEGSQLRIDASVVADDILNAFEPPGQNLQVQLRVRNLSSEIRLVAIAKRRLVCGQQAHFDWVLGPGEPPVEISAGPAVTRPDVATVFSQRLRGSGDPGGCRAFFTIAEARRPYKSPHVEHEEAAIWTNAKELEVRLKPAVEVHYR